MTGALFAAASTFALVVAAFFARFWRTTKDRFFLLFSAAFAVLAIQWMTLATIQASEHAPYYFVLRLFAFLLIIAAIVDKNRR